MNTLRQKTLDYLAAGQASVSALVSATGVRPVEIRVELAAMLAEGLVTEHRVECPRLRVTVYRLSPEPVATL